MFNYNTCFIFTEYYTIKIMAIAWMFLPSGVYNLVSTLMPSDYINISYYSC